MVIQYRLKDDEGRVKGEARERREGNDCDAWGGASVPSQCEAIVATRPVRKTFEKLPHFMHNSRL